MDIVSVQKKKKKEKKNIGILILSNSILLQSYNSLDCDAAVRIYIDK